MLVVGFGVPRLVAGHVAQLGAVGRRRITVSRGPEPVDACVVSILLAETLVVSVSVGVHCRVCVAGFSGSVPAFGRAVPGIRCVDHFAQPLLATFQLAPARLDGGLGAGIALVEERLSGFQQGFPCLGKGLLLILARRHRPVTIGLFIHGHSRYNLTASPLSAGPLLAKPRKLGIMRG